MSAFADTVSKNLAGIDPANTATYTANTDRFKADLGKLKDRTAALKAHHTGEAVAITEPVPLYLLQAAGLVNKTPAEYSHAIEAGQDVPVAVMKDTLDLISARSVKFLAYNNQTEGPQTTALKDAATISRGPRHRLHRNPPRGPDLPAMDERQRRPHRQDPPGLTRLDHARPLGAPSRCTREIAGRVITRQRPAFSRVETGNISDGRAAIGMTCSVPLPPCRCLYRRHVRSGRRSPRAGRRFPARAGHLRRPRRPGAGTGDDPGQNQDHRPGDGRRFSVPANWSCTRPSLPCRCRQGSLPFPAGICTAPARCPFRRGP